MKDFNNDLPWGIHWFRRDLRIEGNSALNENLRQTRGRTLGLFCFDSRFLEREDFSHHRFAFFMKTMQAMREDLRAHGGDLLVVDSLPVDTFRALFKFCESSKISKPSLISYGRDYEPFARARDGAVEDFLGAAGVATHSERDHLLFEPHEVLKSHRPEDYYKVYSPWAKKWFAALNSDEGKKRILETAKPKRLKDDAFQLSWKSFLKSEKFPFEDALEKFVAANQRHVTIEIPEAGHQVALKHLKKFLPAVDAYAEDRDYPALFATSQLSMYMKNGSLTIAHILNAIDGADCKEAAKSGLSKYIHELAWREFYYSILFHRPDVETGPFQKKYEKVKWVENDKHFELWKAGQTGYPLVDAAMRELSATGWITNRVRIVVASFLTKDLLLNWQLGEKHFMNLLLDGDLAPNNGNWQWAASTGSDPNPYFRVLSPWSQSERFDPKGDYIRKFVPELKDAPAKMLHDPAADLSRWKYPRRIVDHSVQREKAIAMFKVVQ